MWTILDGSWAALPNKVPRKQLLAIRMLSFSPATLELLKFQTCSVAKN